MFLYKQSQIYFNAKESWLKLISYLKNTLYNFKDKNELFFYGLVKFLYFIYLNKYV